MLYEQTRVIRDTHVIRNTDKTLCYTRKNAQVVTNLQQTCSNAVPTTCQQDVFALLVDKLPTAC
jgi:3-methyladenine DNA glycosylase Tag